MPKKSFYKATKNPEELEQLLAHTLVLRILV